MQDLNWEVVSAIRANRKKAQEPIYITKNLFLYIIARYRSCGEAYWRGIICSKKTNATPSSRRHLEGVTHHALRLY